MVVARIADDVKEEREFEVIWMNTMIIGNKMKYNFCTIRVYEK